MSDAAGGAPAPRTLAIDWGDRRIGLAVSDALGLLATPAGVVTRRAGKRPPLAELLRQAEALGADAIVIGLPLDPSGGETPRSREVRDVAARLAARTARPVRLVDERFTTAAALRQVRVQGGSTRGRKGDVDALAAAILLEQVLDATRRGVTLGEAVAPPPGSPSPAPTP
jgi:putative Holliday junction resolvase